MTQEMKIEMFEEMKRLDDVTDQWMGKASFQLQRMENATDHTTKSHIRKVYEEADMNYRYYNAEANAFYRAIKMLGIYEEYLRWAK